MAGEIKLFNDSPVSFNNGQPYLTNVEQGAAAI